MDRRAFIELALATLASERLVKPITRLGRWLQIGGRVPLPVGRGSLCLLDNVGMTVSWDQCLCDYAKALSKGPDALTPDEARSAFVDGVLAESIRWRSKGKVHTIENDLANFARRLQEEKEGHSDALTA